MPEIFSFRRKKGVPADKHALRMQARLREEREKQAKSIARESEEVAAKYAGFELQTIVKVDPEGHMYGSVSTSDVVILFAEKGIHLERKNVVLPHAIKSLGTHQLNLKLKEGVMMPFTLIVESDIPLPKRTKEITAGVPEPVEPKTENEMPDEQEE